MNIAFRGVVWPVIGGVWMEVSDMPGLSAALRASLPRCLFYTGVRRRRRGFAARRGAVPFLSKPAISYKVTDTSLFISKILPLAPSRISHTIRRGRFPEAHAEDKTFLDPAAEVVHP
jgi:hypothetical protein